MERSNNNILPNLNFSKLSKLNARRFFRSSKNSKKCENYQNLLESLKNVSLEQLEEKFNSDLKSNISFTKSGINKTINTNNPKQSDIKEDTYTQTSKTIIELATLEKGEMTPDSLSTSPINKRKEKVALLETIENVDFKPNSGETLNFSRLSLVKQYFQEEPTLHPESIKNNFSPRQNSLTEQFLTKKSKRAGDISEFRSKSLQQTSPFQNLVKMAERTTLSNFETGVQLKSKSFVEPSIPNLIKEDQVQDEKRRSQASRFTIKKIRHTSTENVTDPDPSTKNLKKFSFMAPTLSSENKNMLPEVKTLTSLISSPQRGRSVSPKRLADQVVRQIHNIPFKNVQFTKEKSNDCSSENFPIDKDELKQKVSEDTLSWSGSKEIKYSSTNSSEHMIVVAISHLRSSDWSKALKGLAELTELCKTLDASFFHSHMNVINHKLINLLKSPRSHVCRTACQAAGHFFEHIKDIRRPEFDDIVNILLFKTADSNKFIRKDANLALDCMVTHISAFHSIRVLSDKGPNHKNVLVRTATARLVVCAVVIADPNAILNIIGNDGTRKRVFDCLVKFVQDKSPEVRKFGERLYKTLRKEENFNFFLGRHVNRDEIAKVKSILNHYNKR